MSKQDIPASLKIEDIIQGEGDELTSGDYALVHYTGQLEDGTIFDSSLQRNQPFRLRLGVGEVIDGWEMGLLGMKTGSKRRLTIPSSLAYGDRSVGSIPPNSTLIF